MATPVDPDFRARLQALNDKFAVTVPVTMGRIAEALAACVADAAAHGGQPSEAALHGLHELLHGVAGSAGTFGFGMLGQQARRVEQMARAALADSAGWAAVASETEQLLRWAARDPRAETYE